MGGIELMQSIRDVAVFAWALTGINGTLAATYGNGRNRLGVGPKPDGLPVWEPPPPPPPPAAGPGPAAARVGGSVRGEQLGKEREYENFGAGAAAAGYNAEPPVTQYRTRHASLDEGMYAADSSSRGWPSSSPSSSSSSGAALQAYGSRADERAGGYERPPLRPAFSYDALQEHARYQQQQQQQQRGLDRNRDRERGYGPSASSSDGLRAWGETTTPSAPAPTPAPAAGRSCMPASGSGYGYGGYGPHRCGYGVPAREEGYGMGRRGDGWF